MPDMQVYPAIIENLAKDILFAAKMARKSPVFTAAIILILAVGIGGVTAMFTVIRTVLLEPLEYPNPDRIVRIRVAGDFQNQSGGPFNDILFEEMQAASGFAEVGATGIPELVTLARPGNEPESLREERVSANFLDILGVAPLLGRGFVSEEDRPGGANVTLISYELWKRRFGGDPHTVGSPISLDSRDYTVIGVMPPRFKYPSNYDIWVTRPWEWSEIAPALWQSNPHLSGLARLKSGVSFEEGQAELNVIAKQYATSHPGMAGANPHLAMNIEPLEDSIVGNVRPLLWILFGAVLFVLFIVCTNVASLLLVQAASRSREFAVRAAIGASRKRLLEQALVESMAVSLTGAAAGIGLAHAILLATAHYGALDLPRADDLHIDHTVLAFTAAVSVSTGLIFGWLASRQSSKSVLVESLRTQGAVTVHAPATRRIGTGTRGLLVICQTALCVVLLIGATLMVESFVRLRSVDPGFQSLQLLTMQIVLPPARYDTNEKKRDFWDELTRRVRSLPGISRTAVAASVPTVIPNMMAIQSAAQLLNDARLANVQSVSPGYFHAMGANLIRGREFSDRDRDGSSRVVIINEQLARLFWPSYPDSPSPVGQYLLAGGRKTQLEIVGVAANVHEDALAKDVQPEVYFPVAQLPPQQAYLVVGTNDISEPFVAGIRREIAAIDPIQPLPDVQTMTDRLSASIGRPRLTSILLGAFAGVALMVVLVGIYGVIAFLVVERTQEFGIRHALGAQRNDILKAVLGRGLHLMLWGLTIGLAIAFALCRVLKSLLFEVSPTDPWAFVSVSALFLIVGLASCYLPARKAVRIDPSIALRSECS